MKQYFQTQPIETGFASGHAAFLLPRWQISYTPAWKKSLWSLMPDKQKKQIVKVTHPALSTLEVPACCLHRQVPSIGGYQHLLQPGDLVSQWKPLKHFIQPGWRFRRRNQSPSRPIKGRCLQDFEIIIGGDKQRVSHWVGDWTWNTILYTMNGLKGVKWKGKTSF